MRYGIAIRCILAGCLLTAAACSKKPSTGGGDKVLARVGSLEITEEMVEWRAKSKAGDPLMVEPKMTSFTEFVRGLAATQIVNDYGDFVSEASVKRYWRLRELAGLPEGLQKVAGEIPNERFMLLVLALPDYALGQLSLFYATDNRPHGETSERAAALLAKALSAPKKFDAIAKAEGIEIERLWIGKNRIRSALSRSAGKVTETVLAGEVVHDVFSDEERRNASELVQLLAATPVGGVHPRALVAPDSFQVVKVEARKDGEVLVAFLTVPKEPFEDWFLRQARSVRLHFVERKLGVEFLQRFPWARVMVRQEDYPELFQRN